MRAFAATLFTLLALAGSTGAAEPFDPFHQAGIDGRPGAQLPMTLVFRDEAGRSTSLAGLAAGRPMLLVPVQHRCPNICGATLAGVAQAVRAQGYRPGRDFELVAFGIDPSEGDDAATVSVQRLGGGAGVHALTGPARSIAAVTGALGYRYAWDPALRQYAHVAAAAVLTPDGRLSSWLYGVQPPPQVLHAALGAARQGGVGALAERILLFCYHYDPQTGRYGPLAWTLLRGGAGLMVIVLAGFVGISLVRERRRRRAAP